MAGPRGSLDVTESCARTRQRGGGLPEDVWVLWEGDMRIRSPVRPRAAPRGPAAPLAAPCSPHAAHAASADKIDGPIQQSPEGTWTAKEGKFPAFE